MSTESLTQAYRKELIQVMAVAASAVQNLSGPADLDGEALWFIFQDVLYERQRQNAKWGAQDNPPTKWIVILTEELGEAAEAAMRLDYDEVREADVGL